MNVSRNVYEYGREGKCVCLYGLGYTYTGIRILNMQIETKQKTRSAHHSTTQAERRVEKKVYIYDTVS